MFRPTGVTAVARSSVEVLLVAVLATAGAGVAGSQQQPPAGSVTQQQPLRRISAIRRPPVAAEAEVDASSITSSIPMIAIKAIQSERR